VRILRASDYRRMPWRNGAGETVEIAIHPDGSGLDAFDWRVSTASVAADGPFSVFPGIDRTLAVLEGKGIRLAVGGKAAVELTRSSAPLSFAADLDVDARLIDGPITDLNVMTRRGRLRHSVRSLRPLAALDLQIDAATVLVFCHEGGVAIEADGLVHRLDPLETLLADRVAGLWRLIPQGLSHLFLVEINAA